MNKRITTLEVGDFIEYINEAKKDKPNIEHYKLQITDAEGFVSWDIEDIDICNKCNELYLIGAYDDYSEDPEDEISELSIEDSIKETERKHKRIALHFYIKGIEDEGHFIEEWEDLPFVGRYRRIKKFLKEYNELLANKTK